MGAPIRSRVVGALEPGGEFRAQGAQVQDVRTESERVLTDEGGEDDGGVGIHGRGQPERLT